MNEEELEKKAEDNPGIFSIFVWIIVIFGGCVMGWAVLSAFGKLFAL